MDFLGPLFENITHWHWFALAGILLILEIMTPTNYLIWPGAAAAAVGVIVWLFPDLGLWADILIYAVLAVVAGVLGHRYYRKGDGPDVVNEMKLNQRGSQNVGRRAVAAETFVGGQGPIKLDDTHWNAIADGNVAIIKGTPVEIVAADGAVLHVRPV